MSQRGRVRIADVAREAGVSAGTVSRVLNPRDGGIKISEATRKLVLDAVERLGYQPNPFASALRTQQSGVIGAVVRDINDPFLGLMARQVQRAAHNCGVELLLGHAENDLYTVRRQLQFMRLWFDGLLIIGDMPGDQAVFDDLRADETPFVAVACGSGAAAPLVNIDERCGTQLSLDYLHTLGHRRIAFLGTTDHAGTRERLLAFQQYVSDRGLYWDDGYLQPVPYTRRAAIAAMRTLLSLPTPPTAVLCTADLLALGAISGAQEMGWRVPEAVSVISFDDIEEAVDVFPALTTVRQPVGEMAEEAIQLLLRLIENPAAELRERRIIVEPKLMIRRSCAPVIAG